MTELELENISNDNNKSLFRSQRIRLDGKESITPLRALNPSKLRVNSPLNSKSYRLLEIYKSISSEKIDLLQKDQNKHDEFSRSLINLGKKGQSGNLVICIMKYIPTKNPFPKNKEIEFLTDVAYCNSDITPIPMIDTKITDSNFSKFLNYLENCYNTIEELNNKPIMGYVPSIPREFYPKLIDFYLKKSINALYFDFNGQTPDHLKLRPILRHLNNNKCLHNSLIYGINAKPGRALKNSEIIPSKDFIAYGYGLDMLGQTHIGIKGSKEFFEKIKKAVVNQQENKKRLFTKSDYGYHKIGKQSDIAQIYPSDTNISLDDIFSNDNKTYQNLFNMEQQGLESFNLRKRLNELDPNESILKYISKKEQIKKEVRHLELGLKSIA